MTEALALHARYSGSGCICALGAMPPSRSGSGMWVPPLSRVALLLAGGALGLRALGLFSVLNAFLISLVIAPLTYEVDRTVYFNFQTCGSFPPT